MEIFGTANNKNVLTWMVIYVIRNKEMASVGLRSIWKMKKILYFGEHVKNANFKQNGNFRYSKQQKYIKLIVVIV